ncbi:hypothetical protein TURU_072314 [Turdus rufiventris]|nr:hypothetical protein TURU_072314 [Turdus rufiventris]
MEHSWEPVWVSWSLLEDLLCRLSQPRERSLLLLHLWRPCAHSCWLHDLRDLRRDRLLCEEAGMAQSNLAVRPSSGVSSQILLCCLKHLLLGKSLSQSCRDCQRPSRGHLMDLLPLLSQGLPCPKCRERLHGRLRLLS